MRPRLFVPPVSGKQIRAASPNDFALEDSAANVRGLVFIQQNGCRNRRSKSAHRNAWRWMFLFCNGSRVGCKIPHKRFDVKGVGPMRVLQYRSADAVGAKQSA